MSINDGLMILAINPGSTSTKIGLFQDEKKIYTESIEHFEDELKKYNSITDQYHMRDLAIKDFLKKRNFDINKLDAVVGRGGLLPPVKSGAYRVNEEMVDRLKNRPVVEHASNLGAVIAFEMAEELGIPSYIYDSVAVDELTDIARISGMKDIKRKSFSHALNMRAVGIKTAENLGRKYEDMNLIITHLGGGISVSIHEKGRMIDLISDDEGPFSPERAGRVPCKDLIELCYETERGVMKKKLRGKGGLISYLQTNSALEVERMIDQGDNYAELVYEAMAYQISKGIGELATVVSGDVDRIIITGGIAYSKRMTNWIKRRVSYIAPVEVVPGEDELEALAMGAWRVLNGKEEAHTYTLD